MVSDYWTYATTGALLGASSAEEQSSGEEHSWGEEQSEDGVRDSVLKMLKQKLVRAGKQEKTARTPRSGARPPG